MTDLDFSPLLNMADAVAAYSNAIDVGNQKFLAYLPQLYQQTIEKLAAQRLDHTRDAFKNALMYDIQGDLFVVLVRPDDWLATAVEAGVNGWPMVQTHLRGPKTKVSKAGFRYKIIPLRVWGSSPNAKTEKGQDFFQKVKETLKKPRIRPGSLKTASSPSGAFTARQEVLSSYSELSGMERIREYKSEQDFVQGGRPTSSKFVLFRTMSEKFPEKFVHPGIAPANILKDAQTIVEGSLEITWENFVQSELQKVG